MHGLCRKILDVYRGGDSISDRGLGCGLCRASAHSASHKLVHAQHFIEVDACKDANVLPQAWDGSGTTRKLNPPQTDAPSYFIAQKPSWTLNPRPLNPKPYTLPNQQ